MYNSAFIFVSLRGPGSTVAIKASSIKVSASSIHANGRGYNGGDPGEQNAGGPAPGGFGDVGGAGGSHAGVGTAGMLSRIIISSINYLMC